MKYEDGKITFESGNVLEMNGTDSFSISVRAGDMDIAIGCDQVVWYPDVIDGFDTELSMADRAEIADHMIARWIEWKADCAT